MDNINNPQLEAELSKLSPFELKGRIIAMADEKVRKAANTMLNAGRGNPNWVAIEAREAFFALGQFAASECRRDFDMPEGIAGVPQKEGIAVRFETWMHNNPSLPGIDFLRRAYTYCLVELLADADSLVEEWAGGITGHNYPTPPHPGIHRTNQPPVSRLGAMFRQPSGRKRVRPFRRGGIHSRYVLCFRRAET